MRRLVWVTVLMLSLVGFAAPQAQAVPVDFVDEILFGAGSATDLTWTPDGRMLITTQGGVMYIYQNGALLPTPALDLGTDVCTDFERGLLGVSVHPDFATNNYIYVYYTYNLFDHPQSNQCPQKTGQTAVNTPVNRVSRFTLPNTNVIDRASEVVIVDNIPSPGGNHNGGDLLFGKNGNLYISIGDGGNDYETGSGYSGGGGANDAARDPHVLLGKILRVTDTGGVPADNPFTGAGTEPCADDGFATPGNFCQETWAWGLRNPFRIALDPNAEATRIFINDVGQGAREEINEGIAGADYGWNCLEGTRVNSTTGPCNPTPPNMVPPIYEYQHNTGCRSITGGAFVPNGLWPAEYTGAYIYADFVCNQMFVLSNNGGWSATLFDDDVGFIISMAFGPYGDSQALYYASNGLIHRIRYTGTGNGAPTAAFTANPTSGAAPLEVTFDASASSDPEAGALIYFWNFGDGSSPISTTDAVITHTYTTQGNVTASLVVRDIVGQDSAPTEQQISIGDNTAPQVTIDSPNPADLFAVGDEIVFSASATDAEDGAIPAAQISLRVVLHHDTHTHPFLTANQTDTLIFNAPAPEDFQAASNSYLELIATATDSVGASTTITQELQPNKVELTFATDPTDLELLVVGQRISTTQSFTSWENLQIDVSAASQVQNGSWWNFDQWSDGSRAARRTITTPNVDTTYTATFVSTDQMLFLPIVQR